MTLTASASQVEVPRHEPADVAHARRIELLSEKLAGNRALEDWQALHSGGIDAIRFEQKVQTVLFAQAGEHHVWADLERDFTADIEWLAAKHHGRVDDYVDGASAVFFDQPGPCVRMAMELQRTQNKLYLRVGIHTGLCDIVTLRSRREVRCTLIGPETALAAQVAASAAIGSIAVSPETYLLVKDEMQSDTGGCLVMEEFNDSDLAQVCLTPAPEQGGPAMSTFAGLGRL